MDFFRKLMQLQIDNVVSKQAILVKAAGIQAKKYKIMSKLASDIEQTFSFVNNYVNKSTNYLANFASDPLNKFNIDGVKERQDILDSLKDCLLLIDSLLSSIKSSSLLSKDKQSLLNKTSQLTSIIN